MLLANAMSILCGKPANNFQTDDGHLERIRRAELESVCEQFQPGVNVLEIGGGSGFQAAILSSSGSKITSIDIAGRKPAHKSYFTVQDYDGEKIPFPDESFDLVFSSNVLEHVRSLPSFLKEIERVLKPGGTSLHIVPSPSWRFWTSFTHYIYAVRWLLGIQQRVPGVVEPTTFRQVAKENGLTTAIKQLVLAGAHGEYPNAVSELYYFSRRRWRQVFEDTGIRVLKIHDCGVFYTGYAIMPALSIAARKRIARWLGSSCFAVTAKKNDL